MEEPLRQPAERAEGDGKDPRQQPPSANWKESPPSAKQRAILRGRLHGMNEDGRHEGKVPMVRASTRAVGSPFPLRAGWRLMGLVGVICCLGVSGPARAQSADVIRPAADGDFRILEIPGNRGSYRQRFWLVVDRDPRGLWCRDVNGRPSIALKTGSVIETDERSFPATPLLLREGKAYLHVHVKPVDILYDARLRGRGKAAICLVRANSSFIAPINSDSMKEAQP